MIYTVRVWNGRKILLCQTADMPTCMTLLGAMTKGEWTNADMINNQTGEVIVRWTNTEEYGVTDG